MAERYGSIRATVLFREATGESHLRLDTLSPDSGLTRLLCRLSARRTPPPDLFDLVEFQTERAREGGGCFVRDFTTLRKRSALAEHFQAFQRACELATFLRRNLPHLDSPDHLTGVLERALDAFESGLRPEVTLLKTFYLIARREGLPVREQWLIELPSRLQREAVQILQTPLDQQTLPPEQAERLLQMLRQWMEGHAEFIFTPYPNP